MDCGLENDIGHHLYQCLALATAIRGRREPARFFVNANARKDIIPDADVFPWFRASVHEVVSDDFVDGELQDFKFLNEAFLADLLRIDHASFSRSDVVLFPTVIYNQLLGILQWAESFAPASLPRIVVLLMFPPEYTPLTRQKNGPGKLYKYSWEQCPRPIQEHVRLCCETGAMADCYEQVFSVRPAVLPTPISGWQNASFDLGRRAARASADAFLISYLGHGRHEKGFHLLADILPRIRSTGRPLRFFVQASELNEPGLAEVAASLRGTASVNLREGTLTRTDYYSILAASDLTLLPYDPERYRCRGSGVYSEAAVMGTPVVVPGHTWMEKEVHDHLHGVAFERFTPDTVATAVEHALATVDGLKTGARRHAATMRSGSSIEHYLNLVSRL
jgi:glycosyltransferase involved in cell wall biosynthesis